MKFNRYVNIFTGKIQARCFNPGSSWTKNHHIFPIGYIIFFIWWWIHYFNSNIIGFIVYIINSIRNNGSIVFIMNDFYFNWCYLLFQPLSLIFFNRCTFHVNKYHCIPVEYNQHSYTHMFFFCADLLFIWGGKINQRTILLIIILLFLSWLF